MTWYNGTHRHSAIKFVTPEERHTGRDVAILERRHRVYEAARAHNPNRWTGRTRDWSHKPTVALNPNKTISQLDFEVA